MKKRRVVICASARHLLERSALPRLLGFRTLLSLGSCTTTTKMRDLLAFFGYPICILRLSCLVCCTRAPQWLSDWHLHHIEPFTSQHLLTNFFLNLTSMYEDFTGTSPSGCHVERAFGESSSIGAMQRHYSPPLTLTGPRATCVGYVRWPFFGGLNCRNQDEVCKAIPPRGIVREC